MIVILGGASPRHLLPPPPPSFTALLLSIVILCTLPAATAAAPAMSEESLFMTGDFDYHEQSDLADLTTASGALRLFWGTNLGGGGCG